MTSRIKQGSRDSFPAIRRTSAKPADRQSLNTGFRGMSRNLFLILVFILMALPLFTTFNELLTKVVEKTGTYKLLSQYVVPFETRAVSVFPLRKADIGEATTR